MDESLRNLIDQHLTDPLKQYQLAGIAADSVKEFVLGEMQVAIREGDREAWQTLLGMTHSIADSCVKADVLNNLLVMPGHELHQEVTMEIQQLRNPSSIPYIRKVLESGFGTLEYTRSEHEVIAKWFSHALAKINTPESLALIREFASSRNEGIAKEMSYRLERIND
jgi:hypothetical protein